ncbi:MAG: murein biosynthesis integral membrane protein MurJ [Planctomycetota bacterium]|nr:murein biosynthesis integral membrane protein MurJ [Planctomycetota bacterium]
MTTSQHESMPESRDAREPQHRATHGEARVHRAGGHDHHFAGAMAGAIRVVSSLTLLSRFAGLARDVATAHIFGSGPTASAFRAAYAIPNLFRRLFGEGALSAAFLPEYTRLVKDGSPVAPRLASLVCWLLTLVTGLLTLLLEGVLLVILAIAPGDADKTLSLKLMMLMLPMMPMVCITAILGGMLQVHGRFGPPAAAPILLNVFQIAAGALFFVGVVTDANAMAYIVGAAAGLASVAQVAWSLHALRGSVAWTRMYDGAADSARLILKRFVPVLLGLGTLQLNTMLDVVIAMWPIWVGPLMFGFKHPLDDASNGILSYTQALYQFPLGVFGLAVATAVFPLLSRAADDSELFLSTLRRGLRLSLFIGLPASLGLILVREDLVAVVYSGSKTGFGEGAIGRAADVLMGFAPAVWAYSLNHVYTRAFYAKGDTTTPMKLAVCMVALNLTLNLTLLWWLREAGLAWSTAITAAVQCIVLGWLCSRKLGVRILDGATFRGFAATACVTIAMGTAVFALQWSLPEAHRWWMHAWRLMAACLVGAGAFAAAAWVLKLPELRWLMQRGSGGGNAGLVSAE